MPITPPPAVILSPPAQQSGTINVSAEVQGRDFKPGGLVGATAASRYVGATASGAPASGTFVLGDFVLDQSGKAWVCTAGGTPGTWTQIGGGGSTTIPAVQATSSVDFGVVNDGAEVAMPFNVTTYDQGTVTPQHSTVTHNSRLTCQVAGIYHVLATVSWDDQETTSSTNPGGGGTRRLKIWLNFNNVVAAVINVPTVLNVAASPTQTLASGWSKIQTASGYVSMGIGDYVEAYVTCTRSPSDPHYGTGSAGTGDTILATTFSTQTMPPFISNGKSRIRHTEVNHAPLCA